MQVLYEDNHLLAINKPAGVLVQGDETGDKPLVEWAKDYIKEKYAKPGDVFLGVVHRLDRPVSGVVVFARTSKSLSRMNELFRSRETEKIYRAIVSKRPPHKEGTLFHWLLKDEKKNKTTSYIRDTPGTLKSELSYTLLAEHAGRYLLEVR
ncbi:MAG: RNA pseudouridine synthase, partial [Cyclobacteriaceae bacterium]|nr:RNA pseudouridine synthase [Cyclobacteriaceae bacterium]